MSCHVMSCHVMSCHVMSCHVMSCNITSRHVTLRRVMSCHISYNIYRIVSYHNNFHSYVVEVKACACCHNAKIRVQYL